MAWYTIIYNIGILGLLSIITLTLVGLILRCFPKISKKIDEHILIISIVGVMLFIIFLILTCVGSAATNAHENSVIEECSKTHGQYPDNYVYCPMCGEEMD